MDLTINGGTVDFELEGERSLGEVLYSLDKWLDGNGFIISGLDVDGDPVGDDLSKVKDREVSSVGRIDIRTERVVAYRRQALGSACAWLEGLAAWSAGGSEVGREVLAQEGSSLLSTVSGFIQPEEISFLELAQASLNGPDREKAGADFRRIGAIFGERLSECEAPRRALKEAVLSYPSLRESILNIPVWLQTGRDKDAMEAISSFTEAFSKILRLMPALAESGMDLSGLKVGGKPYAGFFSELNGILEELARAFASRDTVLLGDLAEYEILPRLDAIHEALGKAAD